MRALSDPATRVAGGVFADALPRVAVVVDGVADVRGHEGQVGEAGVSGRGMGEAEEVVGCAVPDCVDGVEEGRGAVVELA